MKKAVFILIVLILSLLYYMGVLTKKETLPFAKQFFSVEGPASGGRTWNLEGSVSLSPKELDPLYQLKLDKGLQNVPVLSILLIRASEIARKKGENNQATQMATYAVKFSPDLPQPYYELAQDLWHKNPFQLHKIVPEVLKGITVQFRYYPSSVKL